MTLSRAGAEPEIVLDLSRLLSRILHHTPTGVDRVEMAYARGLLEAVPERLVFGAVHPSGFYGRIPTQTAIRFLGRVQALWQADADTEGRVARRLRVLRTLWTMRPRRIPSSPRRRIFLQSSPHHLVRPGLVRAILRRERALFVCLLHDLIPITHPEYARPGGAGLHHRRVRTLAETADAVIANSHATLKDFEPHLAAGGRHIPSVVAHLGLDHIAAPASQPPLADKRPYFVCLGTIEPRKNHLLLLHIWRDLAERHGAANVPRLIVIGRRGWENEQVVDMLERCPSLAGSVEERARLHDDEVRATLAGARALLLPSFAEGFGMPVPEALVLGTPVICSDLPALREAGGDVPDYLDPLDGPLWRDHILAYAVPGSAAASGADRANRALDADIMARPSRQGARSIA